MSKFCRVYYYFFKVGIYVEMIYIDAYFNSRKQLLSSNSKSSVV